MRQGKKPNHKLEIADGEIGQDQTGSTKTRKDEQHGGTEGSKKNMLQTQGAR